MHSCGLLVVAVAAFAILVSTAMGMAAPVSIQCQPNALSDAPPKLRRLCYALEVALSNANVNGYDEQVKAEPELMDTQLYDRGTKRQDVDHVFLRFGRRE